MKLNVPELLKQQLVDDWENITKNCQVVPLPREPTVEQVLEEWGEWVVDNKPAG